MGRSRSLGPYRTVTDPAGNTITNTYDIRGNKVLSRDPDLGSWAYTYDVLGELTGQTDNKSQTTTLTYDVLGRALSRTEPSLYSAWTFGTSAGDHNVGKQVEAKACTDSGCGRVVTDRTYIYDSLGRPQNNVLHTWGNDYGYSQTYDSTNGQLAGLTYPSGLVVQYAYNAFGYQTELTDAQGSLIWRANTRDAEMHLTSQTQGNGVVTTQTFDPDTGLMKTQRAGGGAVASFDYSFDTIGNLTARTDNVEAFTERFCYDSLNRLTNANIGSVCTGGKTAAYDAIGNITAKSDAGTYSYPSSGSALPHAVSAITGTVDGLADPQYSYDANGNMTCVSSGAACTGTIARSVTVTSFNMADGIIQGTTSLSLAYDDQHQRVRQVNTVSGTATTTTLYLNDPASGALSEAVSTAATTPTAWNAFDWAGAPWGGTTPTTVPTWVDYIQVGGQILAQRSTTYQAGSLWGFENWGGFNWDSGGPTVDWAYFTLDHLNSVAVISDQEGSVIQRLSYDAWGKQRNADGTDAACGAITSSTTRGFINQEQMPAACLVNLNARIYDPSIGRFMAGDPVIGDFSVPQELNRYAYSLNNPLSLSDPSGLCFLGCFWKSPIFSVVLDVALIYVGLPELEAAVGITTPAAAGVTAAFAAASQSGITLVANGAIAGAASAGVSGGNVLKGALVGGLEAGLFNEAGDFLTAEAKAGTTVLGSQTLDTFVSHGLVGGIGSVAGGGSFGSGFLSGGVSSFTPGPTVNAGWDQVIEGSVESAVLGGAASALGGGKFANGAETGAFGYLFNDLAHCASTGQCTPEEARQNRLGVVTDPTSPWLDVLGGIGAGQAAADTGILGRIIYSGVKFYDWLTGASEEGGWNLGDNKSAQKWQNQMQQRGWTSQQIDDAVANGQQFSAPNNINPANGATRYVNPQTGRSVVLDNTTRQVIHVGGDGFKY